jgi:uncharacterized heparinase superfamily protein
VSATILLERPVIRARLDPDLTSQPALEGLLAGRFTIHGETHYIGTPVNWLHNPSDDIEWHIVLHKFFHAPGLVQRWRDTGEEHWIDLWKAHTNSWIKAVEPGHIAADVTGRRVRNWVYALSLYGDEDLQFIRTVELSLREQLAWLIDNLHPSRNHRTLELFAVLIGAVWLHEARWTDFALDALADNAEADFLPDGAHVELSSHYHCLALRNLMDAIELAEDNRIAVPASLRTVVGRAGCFASALHKPDGSIPMLSDADTGDYRAMLPVVQGPELIEHFPDAGYVFLRDQAAVAGDTQGSYLSFDCGSIGAGNHGHLDCLSIEFASQGRSLIVDPGRFSYNEAGDPNWRAAFRRTRAHSLVQVNGLDQTRYTQGPKRMKVRGTAPTPIVRMARDTGAYRIVCAEAQSAEYSAKLTRTIIAHDEGWWLVHDRMTATEQHHYELLFQLDPAAQDRAHRVEMADSLVGVLSPNLLMIPLASGATLWQFEQGWIAPRYGERLAAPRFVSSMDASEGWFATLLLPFADEPPHVSFSASASQFSVNGQLIDFEGSMSC